MKTRNIFTGVCFALFLTLAYGQAGAQSSNSESISQAGNKDSLQLEIDRMHVTIDKMKEAKDKIKKEMDKNKDLPDYAKSSMQSAIDELDNGIAEKEIEIAQLEIDHANTMVSKLDTAVAIASDGEEDDDDQPGKDSMIGKRIELGNGFIKINLKDKDTTIHFKKDLPNAKTQILGLDLGENFLLENNQFTMSNENRELELSYPKSINVTLYLIRQGLNLVQHKLYATASLAIDYHDYRFKNDITLERGKDAVSPMVDSIHFSKNKLSAHYLMVPITLNFETNPAHPNRSFKLAIGGYGEMLVKSYTKQVSEERGKQHFSDDYNLNKIAYGLIGQIGFGSLQFYTHYSLAPVFEKGKTPGGDLYPLTFGIVVNGFKWRS